VLGGAEDGVDADFADPQNLNLYGYVRNNPPSHADADGHDCETCPDVGEIEALVNQGTAEGRALIAGAATSAVAATGAAGTAVVGAFYVADSRITDAYVDQKNGEAKLAAEESRTAVENHQIITDQADRRRGNRRGDDFLNTSNEELLRIYRGNKSDPRWRRAKEELKARGLLHKGGDGHKKPPKPPEPSDPPKRSDPEPDPPKPLVPKSDQS